MARRKPQDRCDPIAAAIAAAGTIGALERLAGIGQSDAGRFAFWQPFARLPASEGLDAGVADLKRRIRAQGLPGTPS